MGKYLLFICLSLCSVLYSQSGWHLQSTLSSLTNLHGVKMITSTGGYAVGEGDLIIKTTDGGSNWTPLTSSEISNISAISFSDMIYGSAVGDNIIRTTNGGSVWVTQTNPSTSGNSLYNVFFINSTTGWIVGESAEILKTTNGGTLWVEQTSSSLKALYGVCFTDVNTGTLTGADGTILRTTNGGITWTAQTSPISTLFETVFFLDANNGWAVGGSSSIIHTTNGGANWTAQTSGIVSTTLHSVCFTDLNHGTIVGLNGIMLRTTNGGANWQLVPSLTANHLECVSFSDINNGTAVGYNGVILRTTNGGTTFVNEKTENPEGFSLNQNYPNPFNPNTIITYNIPKDGNVSLRIYNLMGQEVAAAFNQFQRAGEYNYKFSAEGLASGVYLYKLTSGNISLSKKMIIMK